MEKVIKKIIIATINLIMLPINIPYVFLFSMCEWLIEKDKTYIRAYKDAWNDWAISIWRFPELKNKPTGKQ